MKAQEKINQALSYFKKSYSCKMGGTQTVILPNGKSQYFDDREYYSGRGAKYNSKINHHIIGDVKVTRKEYSDFLKMLMDREERRAINLQKRKELSAQIETAKENGIYAISQAGENSRHFYIELSEEEAEGRFFDADRLANTLDIRLEDAQLLYSEGKTYVFAQQIKTGKIIELYHPSLSCNALSISFSYPSQERIEEFEHEEWVNAPYSAILGQTERKNHFVC
jgi:hypothetical protein